MEPDNRPVNLNLIKFHFPVMAVVSILHRIAGVVLFLFIPVLLYLLHTSLISQTAFSNMQNLLVHPIARVLWIVLLAAVVYHWLAGVRHLVMDFGIGESQRAGRVTAWSVIILCVFIVVLIGIRLW